MQGNDVISDSRGANLLFGDEGQDYIIMGQDAAEIFGGSETDFILGGQGKDFILGNEGDDWIEGGEGFDTIAGENSELFFNSPIIGHDVLFGQGDEKDYDAESGDDIMGRAPASTGTKACSASTGAWPSSTIRKSGSTCKSRFSRPSRKICFATALTKPRRYQAGRTATFSTAMTAATRVAARHPRIRYPPQLFTDHLLTAEGIDRIAGLRGSVGQSMPMEHRTLHADYGHRDAVWRW